MFKGERVKSLIYGTGLLVCYLVYGIYQERIMTVSYGGEKFQYIEFLVLQNRLVMLIVSSFVLYWTCQSFKPATAMTNYILLSFTTSLSIWSQYDALKYLSFPLVVILKCAKTIPSLLISNVFNFRSFQAKDYLNALFVIIACLVFTFS